MDIDAGWSLLCRVGARLCALPLSGVIETMRPLPVEPVAGAPDFVLGLAVVRGATVPIVDAGRLVAGAASSPTRFVMLKVGERRVGLAVDAVLGARQVSAVFEDLPPLLKNAESERVSAIGVLDADLLMVLKAARLVPEEVLADLESSEAVAS